MIQQQNIGLLTILLSLVGGYCDTVTFVSADSIFSAHITGNFIVFANQILTGSDPDIWIKLLTFPVFILSVISGGWIAAFSTNRYLLLLIEGILLIVSSSLPYLFKSGQPTTGTWITYTTAMMIVFSIGLQNAFGKLYSNETYAPTTMMTGNVTLLSLSIGSLVRAGFNDAVSLLSIKNLMAAICGFLVGCVLGGLISILFGLSAVLLPGFTIIIWYIKMSNRITKAVAVI